MPGLTFQLGNVGTYAHSAVWYVIVFYQSMVQVDLISQNGTPRLNSPCRRIQTKRRRVLTSRLRDRPLGRPSSSVSSSSPSLRSKLPDCRRCSLASSSLAPRSIRLTCILCVFNLFESIISTYLSIHPSIHPSTYLYCPKQALCATSRQIRSRKNTRVMT
jgi:hypothetical protein